MCSSDLEAPLTGAGIALPARANPGLPFGITFNASRPFGADPAVRQALRADQICAAEDRGGAMSMATAAEYALMVGAPSSPQAPPTGLPKLSAREQELVRLVARGSSDAQIAAQLYISVHTVGSHLDRIRDKTGCRRRADLTRLALSTGLV